MFIIKIIAFCLFLTIASIALAQNNEANFPETVSGRRAAAYFAAFNSGDEQKMTAFFTENVSDASLKQRPVEARLQTYKQMRAEMQNINFRRVLEAKPEKISALVQNQRGEWLRFDFMFEPSPPHKLVGIGIDEAADPATEANLPETLNKTQFASLLDEHLNKLTAADEFSGVVLVAKNDQPIYQKAFGLASREFNVPNRVDTKFNLGSINKLFTQIAIAQLVAAGKLSYDDKIGKILPDYPNRDAAEKVTVRHLLTMTSGIGDFFGDKYTAMSKDRLRDNKDYFQLFAAEPLQFEPGANRRYSNGSYIVLGTVIEKLSGQSYYDYVRRNIFEVAGMTNTDSYASDEQVANLAEGYTREGVADKKVRRNNILTRPARGSAAGGGYSNAQDMLKFSLALQSGKLRQNDFNSPNGQAQKAAGMGFAGGSLGINSIFEMDVETGYTVVVMTNYDPPTANQAGKFVRTLLSRLKD